MKTKVLFMSMLVMASMAFVACNNKPGEDPAAITGIKITPDTLILDSENPTARLTYTLTPAGATAVVEWSSSDTAIAVVDEKGNVYAVDFGQCIITAKCGSVEGKCVVLVKTYLDNITFNAATVYNVDTTYFGLDTVHIQSSAGKTFICYKTLATLYIMSEGFYFNDQGYLDGAKQGTMIEANAMFYYGTPYLNGGQGASFILGEWAITDKYEFGQQHVAKPGSIDQNAYITWISQFCQSYNNAKDQDELIAAYYFVDSANHSMQNTKMRTFTYHSTSEGYPQDSYYGNLMDDGFVTSGYFICNANGPSKYMVGFDYGKFFVTALNNVDYTWGCDITVEKTSGNYAGATLTLNNNTLNTEEHEYTYGVLKTESASIRVQEVKAPIMSIDYPEVAARMQEQLAMKNHQVNLMRK